MCVKKSVVSRIESIKMQGSTNLRYCCLTHFCMQSFMILRQNEASFAFALEVKVQSLLIKKKKTNKSEVLQTPSATEVNLAPGVET